ncbi:hypothetical protein JOF36_002636 [Pseudonocardia parietis]|uniref:FXSXX-COOH protein n=1 Tax=Pseudonocardia parietis TaxID=570936 RepID=A0ABS4VSR3_9PSEU|nr:hypothetical protein [Pseudonocardia parietis]
MPRPRSSAVSAATLRPPVAQVAAALDELALAHRSTDDLR